MNSIFWKKKSPLVDAKIRASDKDLPVGLDLLVGNMSGSLRAIE